MAAEAVSIAAVVHVIFAMELTSRRGEVCGDLNQFVPINSLAGVAVVRRLPIPSRLRYRDVDDITAGLAEGTAPKLGVTRGKSTPAVVDLRISLFDEHGPDVDGPFQSLVGHLM